MMVRKEQNLVDKNELHPRNKNRKPYGFEQLISLKPALGKFMKLSKHGINALNFANPTAVKVLNQALLHQYYGIENWDFPDQNLCPPIPGRADYLHYLADLLAEGNKGEIPTGDHIKIMGIGVGANCIYPIIGVTEYGWNFISTDVDENSVKCAKSIVESNESLQGKIEIVLQLNPSRIFRGIVSDKSNLFATVCKLPFQSSAGEAISRTRRKVRSHSDKNMAKPALNFAGVSNELFVEGGEYKFTHTMISESVEFAHNDRLVYHAGFKIF